MTDTNSGPPWEYKIQLWEKSDSAAGSREGGHTGEKRTVEGFSWEEGDRVDVLNDVLYGTRGVKSEYELAWIDYIRPAESDGGDGE